MDMIVEGRERDSACLGRKVLVLMPRAGTEDARVLECAIEAAKKRWGWKVDAVCIDGNRRNFECMVQGGTLFSRPGLLDPASWECDAAQVADIDRRLGNAERIGGFPVGKLIAAAPATIGRAYVAAVRRRISSPMSRKILADNTEPFRIFRRFFAFAEEVLDASKPDIVICFEWATPLHSAVRLAAIPRGVVCVALRRSKLIFGEYFWTTDPFMLNRPALTDAAARQEASLPVSDQAVAQIVGFRDKPKIVDFIQVKWQNQADKKKERSTLKKILWPVMVARMTAFDFLYPGRFRDSALRPSISDRIFGKWRKERTVRKQQRFFQRFDDSSLAAMKYVYFPMHKETDLPLCYQASSWHDQRNTVGLLASSLPSGCKLLVREHRMNSGDRPSSYYEEMSRLPNVVLIDAFDSQFKYIRHADLVVTDNGSSGWEGLILQRSVITLAETFYDGAGLAARPRCVDDLPRLFLDKLDGPAVLDHRANDLAIGRMIDAEAATTFSFEGDTDLGMGRLAAVLVPLLQVGTSRNAEPRAAEA